MNTANAQTLNPTWVASRTVQLSNKLGLHARPAAVFARTANRYACDILVEKDGEKVDGKSVLGLLLLAAGHGSCLTVHAQGQDAPIALAELERLFEQRFGEVE